MILGTAGVLDSEEGESCLQGRASHVNMWECLKSIHTAPESVPSKNGALGIYGGLSTLLSFWATPHLWSRMIHRDPNMGHNLGKPTM